MATVETPINILNGNSSHCVNSDAADIAANGQTTTAGRREDDLNARTAAQQSDEANGTAISSETLKIIGQIKNIEKINEKRRIFLNNTLSESSTLTTSTETTAAAQEKIENGLTYKSISKEIRQEKSETKIQNDNEGEKLQKSEISAHHNEKQQSVTKVQESSSAEKTNSETSTKITSQQPTTANASATSIKSPLTPPPKPPMLSRTRSLGVGDQRPPAAANFNTLPKTPYNTPNSPTMPTPLEEVNDANRTTPIIAATITTATLASPMKVAIESTPEHEKKSAPVVRRTIARPMSVTPENAQSVSLNHYERLIEELKCPGCASPMKAPILLCQTGHSVCSQCTRILLMCPLCKEPFTSMRSRTVEALCHKAHFRCMNAAGGCTTRLHTDLLPWHEKQCVFKPMKCFMGRVWGDCQWSGREIFWKDHLEEAHTNRLFHSRNADLIWNMGVKQKPLTGYYVFSIYDELFNFFEIYDNDRVLFTMTCTSTVRDRKHNFAYEVTIVHPDNDALAITQKYPVHSEYDKDILANGTCVSIPFSDLAKFIDDEKLLHYNVRLLEVKSPRKIKTPRYVAMPSNGMHPVDFQQTQIECINIKGIPSTSILTRKTNDPNDDFPFADNALTPSSNGTEIEAGAVGLDDEDVELRKRYYGNESLVHDSGSESDPELEAYIAKKWGTPQLHFNRKYLKDTSVESGSSVVGEAADRLDDRMSVSSKRTSYAKKMTNTLRKSFRSLKAPMVELKPLTFVKKSPEKKSP